MDRQRIRRAGMGKRASAALNPGREKLRMIVYGIVAVAIFSLLVAKDGDPPPTDELPDDRYQTPREYEPLARVDPARLTSVRDDTDTARAVLEPGPLQHLIDQASKLVYGDMAQLGVQAVPRAELLADSAARRGDPVWVLGRMQWYELDSYTDPISFRGEVLDERGESWLFQVVTPPRELDFDDVVRLNGFYLKHHDMLRPDRSFASGPLVVAEELLPSAFRLDPVTELTPEMFRGVRDYDMELASRPLDSLPYFQLLSYVANTPADEIFGPVEEREPMYASVLLKQQDEWRGKPVTVRGNLLHMQRSLLGPSGENPLGQPYVWDLWLLNRTGGPTHVVMLEEPVGLVGGRDMLVDVDGLFFRRQVYENKNNQAMVASVLIGARAREFIIPEDEITPWIQRIVLGMGMLLLTLIAVAQLREGKLMARARVRSVARKKRLIALPGTLAGLKARSRDTSGGAAADPVDDGSGVASARGDDASGDGTAGPGHRGPRAGDAPTSR